MKIITEEMVKRAISLAVPSAKAILAAEGMTWGPRWVEGFVTAPGLGEIPFRFGEVTKWNPKWGDERDFQPIAYKKLQLAKRTGDDTSIVVSVCPWQIQEGEYLYPGGVSRFGISAGASGAKGRTDEALADILVCIIMMLANLETDRRKEAKEMQI